MHFVLGKKVNYYLMMLMDGTLP